MHPEPMPFGQSFVDESVMSEGTKRILDSDSVTDLPIELALIRWTVVSNRWSNLSSGNMPSVKAFLAGWLCRMVGVSRTEPEGHLRDSFRAGWAEADEQIQIERRSNNGGDRVDEQCEFVKRVVRKALSEHDSDEIRVEAKASFASECFRERFGKTE